MKWQKLKKVTPIDLWAGSFWILANTLLTRYITLHVSHCAQGIVCSPNAKFLITKITSCCNKVIHTTLSEKIVNLQKWLKSPYLRNIMLCKTFEAVSSVANSYCQGHPRLPVLGLGDLLLRTGSPSGQPKIVISQLLSKYMCTIPASSGPSLYCFELLGRIRFTTNSHPPRPMWVCLMVYMPYPTPLSWYK